MTLFRWTDAHLALLAHDRRPAPLIDLAAVPRIVPELDLWDHWPVLDEAGALATVNGGLLVIALSAPILPDPDLRHAVARLRLLHRRVGEWRDLGNLLPDGLSPGSREWAGSAVVDAARRRLNLFFTAAGKRGEQAVRFDQRLYTAAADLNVADGSIQLRNWTSPSELVRPDGVTYATDMTGGGAVGTIKAFRDPYLFCDPMDGSRRILFAASRAGVDSDWNGLIGAAQRDGAGWTLLPPLVDATGVSNELERPHAIVHNGRVYLFWSTQTNVFAPGRAGPTGLYGVVAERFGGPWQPLNGHGLVLANPAQAPAQAYSWQVLPNLSVWSFADLVSLAEPPADTQQTRAHFAGTPAPPLQLRLDGARAELTPAAASLE